MPQGNWYKQKIRKLLLHTNAGNKLQQFVHILTIIGRLLSFVQEYRRLEHLNYSKVLTAAARSISHISIRDIYIHADLQWQVGGSAVQLLKTTQLGKLRTCSDGHYWC